MPDTHECLFCREKTVKTSRYCRKCTTKPERKAQIELQLEIEKENKNKGYKIPDTLFGVPRKNLLDEYQI